MKQTTVPTVLTIAGSDSGGGAGIQGDLKTLEAFGVFGLTVLTSVTAQNTRGVLQVYDLPVDVVVRQIQAVAEDIPISAAKTGMLSNREIIESVATQIRNYRIQNLVVDPVMRAKSGDALIEPEAESALIKLLLPLACVVTPNVPEAERLGEMKIGSRVDMREAARVIQAQGPQAVLVKGGHLEVGSDAVDILYDGLEFHEFSAERVDIPGGVHGTGCAYSAAIAAGLAKGRELVESINRAKAYITKAIKYGYRVGAGHPVLAHSCNSFN